MTDEWATLAQPFVDGAYATVKGRVRTFVVHRQLLRHLPPAPATILDIGGGAGHQSIPLARVGYDVTILDSSPAMLERADQLRSIEPPDVGRRISLLEGPGERALEYTGGRRYAAVLCHGVLMYVLDPQDLLASITQSCAPNGLVSILALNAAALAVRPALEGRWQAAFDGFSAREEIGVLGVPTRGETVEELSMLLEQHSTVMQAWYGVWMFSDWLELAGKPVPDDQLLEAAEVELRAGDTDPYRQLSRLIHVVGQRR